MTKLKEGLLTIKEDRFIKITYGALVAIFATVVAFAGAFYSVRAETAEATRRLDRQRDYFSESFRENREFQSKVLESLSSVKADIAVIKSQLERKDGR